MSEFSKQDAITFLTGYVRGLWIRYGQEPDPMVVAALKKLGAKPDHLPQIKSPVGTK